MSVKLGSPVYYCGQCEYKTESDDKWFKHLNDGKHTESGSSPCVVCNTIVEYKHKTIGKSTVCNDCKKELAK